MARFFVDPEQIRGDFIELAGPEVRHLRQVLRLRPGDIITILDGQGNAYQAAISGFSGGRAQCRVLSREPAGGEPPLKVILVQGLPKGDKMEAIIQKGTELGLAGLMPAQCARSVVRLEGRKALERRERWQRVALEAAKQCRRAVAPRVEAPRPWAGVMDSLPPGSLVLMPWEGETVRSLRQVLEQCPGVAGGEVVVYILIGPEGGFEPAEVELARSRGAVTVSLGPRILRTETAGPALLAVLMYLWGDLGGSDKDEG
ncbi:MAG: 16S rRNA (uracil(1498)-N(3))-methyltransferase [Bacillota bacterium]